MRKMDWAVVLAGGAGTRFRSFTREVSGDNRPKQFCRFLNGRTPLEHTRTRVGRVVPPARTLFAVTREHEGFYRRDLADCQPFTIIEQPCSRGTTAAIAYALARLRWFDPDPVISVFPADHHFAHVDALRRCVLTARPRAGACAGVMPSSGWSVASFPQVPASSYGAGGMIGLTANRATLDEARRRSRPVAFSETGHGQAP